MHRGKGHLHKKWGSQIMKVHYYSYMLFNFKGRQSCLKRQYSVINIDGATCVRLATVVVQVPQKGFSDINDLSPWSPLLRRGGPWLV